MDSEFDPLRRELCPDGTCIGVIGPDGHCKECGAVGPSVMSDARNRGLRAPARETEPPEGFAERQLCPDGACVGVIGDDGRCGECGRQAEVPAAAPRADHGDGSAAAAAMADAPDAAAAPSATPGDDFENRRLCPDGACIGLLGPDGRCKECGRSGS